MDNINLKQTYDKMHKTGKGAWFDDGWEERRALLEMGMPWEGKSVLEIGCGEGDLLDMVFQAGGQVVGIDYSEQAIETCKEQHPHLDVYPVGIEDFHGQFDVLLMQGVMEHLDRPFETLAYIIESYKPSCVVMSMPCFVNPRGIVWHTLDMLGAVMSKTDLHLIDPWEVTEFCRKRGYCHGYETIDLDWGNGKKMLEDLHQRIPLALKDGGISAEMPQVNKLLEWLEKASGYFDHDQGAVNIYRIDI